MTFTDLHVLASNKGFKNIVEMAILKVSTAIIGEDGGDVADIITAKRHDLAMSILGNSIRQAELFAKHIVSGGNILAAVNAYGVVEYSGTLTLDQDVEYIVSQLWNDRAGITFGELNIIVE